MASLNLGARCVRKNTAFLGFSHPQVRDELNLMETKGVVDNFVAVGEACLTADDVWLWAAILRGGSAGHRLRSAPHRPVATHKLTKALSNVNATANYQQFLAAQSVLGPGGGSKLL
jgi:hypothetical protein